MGSAVTADGGGSLCGHGRGARAGRPVLQPERVIGSECLCVCGHHAPEGLSFQSPEPSGESQKVDTSTDAEWCLDR